MIDEKGHTPYLNDTAMVKNFTYDNGNWLGYDDEETYALRGCFANNRCLCGIMIWLIDYNAETGGGGGMNNYTFPQSATVIPMGHITIPSGATSMVDSLAATDILGLPDDGNQNTPVGPGAENCNSCSCFRLITSTCCWFGGSIGNLVLIPDNMPTPMC